MSSVLISAFGPWVCGVYRYAKLHNHWKLYFPHDLHEQNRQTRYTPMRANSKFEARLSMYHSTVIPILLPDTSMGWDHSTQRHYYFEDLNVARYMRLSTTKKGAILECASISTSVAPHSRLSTIHVRINMKLNHSEAFVYQRLSMYYIDFTVVNGDNFK